MKKFNVRFYWEIHCLIDNLQHQELDSAIEKLLNIVAIVYDECLKKRKPKRSRAR